MARTITGYREHGGRYATLNTQADNAASHRLYKKFGFIPNGEVIPLWVLPITGERTKVRTTNQYEEV
jgi:RimJ/RimL family protein N-acetyltransferase